jgi:predicted DNA-binding transcriptional regulator AlpA
MAKINRIALSDAKAISADWEAQHEEHQRSAAIVARFQDAGPSEVIKMWETGKNEQGRKLSNFEFAGLVERWCELFGALPPDDAEELNGFASDQTPPQEPEPEDDTMLRMGEVVRLTGISGSTIKRMVIDGRFPKPTRLSPRRIGWQARDVKAWLRQLDDQRRAPRQ